MEMTTAKTIAVFAIIFGCFAVLYPKIFHPMLMHMLGNAPEKKPDEDILNRVPPHLRAGMGAAGKGGGMDDLSRHMRGGPHPGLRAAAEMKKQAASQPGSGRGGMMSVVLPMYAIGIVVYLIYTLTKVFGSKREEPQKSEDYLSKHNPFADIRFDPEQKKFVSGVEADEFESNEYRRSNSKQRDLERLLLKADERKISEDEMQQLKRRLLETEAQMSRILNAMENVQTHVGQAAEQCEQYAAQQEQDSPIQTQPKSTDLSPDMDSYEIISGKSKDSPIEDLGSVEDYHDKDNVPNEPAETTTAHGYQDEKEAEKKPQEFTTYDDEDDDEDEEEFDGKAYDDDDIDEGMYGDNDDDDDDDEDELAAAAEMISKHVKSAPELQQQHPDLRQRKPVSKDDKQTEECDEDNDDAQE